MARYTEDSIRDVKNAVDMVDLVGTRTALRRVNPDSYTGLCPFHDERTPSFSIKPSEKVYFCFGCQASGDAIRFAQETEGLDFIGAIEFLADRYGVTLETAAEAPAELERRRRRERLHALLDRTCSFFERVLWESREAAGARAYLAGRGLEEPILREFRVGYAPSAWDRVLDGSRRAGFTEAELLAADIVLRSTERPGSVYGRFRRRITFPLCDRRGRVLGFGARAMGDAQGPKYLNSRDGEIYHKGRHLFGAHLARGQAAKAGAVVLCEGYTDVIAAHQAGVRNCVGLMGTALTKEQLDELGRLAPAVVLALDADGAGFEAMLKAARIADGQRIGLRVAALPAGSDPADVLERDGPEAVRGLLGQSVPFVRFRIERVLDSGDRESGEGRDRILDALRPIFAELGPGATREELEREVASRLAVSEKVVERLLTGRDGAASATDDAERSAPALAAGERTERAFLELCIALPARGRELLDELDLDGVFASPLARAAAAHLRTHLDTPSSDAGDGPLAALLAELAVRASGLAPVPAELEVERGQLELARVERAIAGARGVDAAGVSALVLEREAVKRELDDWLGRALAQTAERRD
jgi:DNA primase